MTYTKEQIREILTDAENCPRLTTWETNFLASIDNQILYAERQREKFELTERQELAMNRIEEKVYRT